MDINEKMQQVLEAVKSTGVVVNCIDYRVETFGVDVAGTPIPKITRLELKVELGLELEATLVEKKP